jgi:hypothetical protein
MGRFLDDVLAEQVTEPAAGSSNNETEQPPRMPPIQRVVELIESLFVLEKDLVGELLAELAMCSADDLIKLFNCTPPANAVTTAPAYEQPATAEPERLTEAERVRRDYEGQRWDAEGRRIGQRAFVSDEGHIPLEASFLTAHP